MTPKGKPLRKSLVESAMKLWPLQLARDPHVSTRRSAQLQLLTVPTAHAASNLAKDQEEWRRKDDPVPGLCSRREVNRIHAPP